MWGQIAAMGGSLLGGLLGARGERRAAQAYQQNINRGIGAIQGFYDQSRNDFSPYLGVGQQGASGLTRLMGGDYSGFENSPDYLYARDQMIQGGDRSASANGRLFSGGYQVDLAKHLNGLASQNLGNYRGALFDMANLGQNSAANLGSLGASAGGNIASLFQNNGAMQAQSHQNRGSIYGGMAGGLGRGLGSLFGGMGGG